MARTKPAAKAEQKPTPEKLKRKLAELKKSTVVGEADEDSNSGGGSVTSSNGRSATNSPDSEAVKQGRQQGNGVVGRKSSQEQGKKDLKQDKSKDRWGSIEKGETGLSAAEVFRSFDLETPTAAAKLNGGTSSRKQKRKKSSDGLDAPRIEVHGNKKQKVEEEKDEQGAHSAKTKDKLTVKMEKDRDKTPQNSKSSLSQDEKVNGSSNKSSSRKNSSNIFKSLLESSPSALTSPNFTIAANPSPNADTAIYSSPMKKSRSIKQSHAAESPDGILVNSSASKLKQSPKGKNASVVNRTMLLSDDDEEEEEGKKKGMNKTKAEKSKTDEAEIDEDSFLMQRRKGSAKKKNRLRVDSSSDEEEEEEEEEEESDEDEDEMDEDEESSDNRADASIRNAIRKHFIDDEAEEVNVPIDEQDEELTSEDGFIVDDGEDLTMTDDDDDEDSDPTAVEGEEEMVTDESSDDDLMGEDRQPETVQGTLRMSFEPMNLDAFPFNVEDSLISANKTFAWLISPYDSQKFFNDVYQKTVLHVKRNNRKHYGNLFSAVSLAKILEEQYLEYTTNINVAMYRDGKRTTLNGKGQAYANVVKDHIQNGCSIQLVNPQTFDDRIWYVCELLQELFGCFVGANTYLTPSGSAGFAPHWDDIDAFILQVEGRKHWTVYAPRNAQEELPLESSGNLSLSDLSGRRPVWEGWVETGDMLYVPRGFIHMAKTDPSTHSLHVTLSTGMHHSFVDLLKHMMDDALDLLSDMRSKVRRGLPVGYLDMGGVAELPYSNEEQHIQKFVHPLYRHLRALRNMAAERMGDSAIDLMAREFFKTALPPRLTPAEREHSALGVKTNLLNRKPLEWSMKNRVRIIRRHTQRLIYENEDTAFIIHRLSNSRIYGGRPEIIVDFNIKWVPVFAALMCSYPEWIGLKELSQNEVCKSLSKDDLMNAVLCLYTNGMLLVKWT